ncbi:MAG TPA: ABC transporter permease [Burkholderiaceae bacterium]|nr:ABC transporter permease [Burkholderiaceae bacterium]
MSNLINRLTTPNGLFDRAWPPVLMFIILAGSWEGLVRLLDVPVYVLPAPRDIYLAIIKSPGTLLWHSGITLFEAVAGFIIGSFLGAILGTVFAYSKILARGFLPYIIAANTIPVVAIAPIIIIWFGHGLASKIAVTTFLSFFPLALNMMKGLQSYDRTVMDVFHISAATEWQRFFKMRLPSAIPYVFVGLKLNVTFSVIGAIIAEFVQSDKGMGFLIMTAYRTLAMPRLWATMLMSALIGIIFFLIVAWIERAFVRWHASSQDDF